MNAETTTTVALNDPDDLKSVSGSDRFELAKQAVNTLNRHERRKLWAELRARKVTRRNWKKR